MSVRQSFLFNTLFILGVNFIIKPVWVFGIDRTVQNELGGEIYGLYFAIFNYVYIFQILLDFGLQNFNQTEIASNNSRFKSLFPGMLMAKLFLTLSYFILTVLVGIALGYSKQPYFIWLIINQIILSFNVFLRSNVSAHRMFILDAFLSIIDKVIMILGSAMMLIPSIHFLDLNIENFIWIQTFSFCIASIFCIYYNLRLSESFDWKVDLNLFKSILKQSIPFAIVYFLMTIYYRIDSVMIEQMLPNGAVEAGIYAQSYRIMESVNNIGYIIAGILLPLFAYRLGQFEATRHILRHGYGLMFTIIIPIVIGGVVYSQDIFQTLYPDENIIYSSRVFILLLLNFIPVGLLYVLGPLLTANKNFKIMIPSLVIGCLLNILINYFLIPSLGAQGAAIATLCTQLFMLIVYSIAIVYVYKFELNWKLLLQSSIFIAIVLGINFGMHHTQIFWILALLITGVSSILISYILKIVSKETLALKIH